jgi:hypothetical protein
MKKIIIMTMLSILATIHVQAEATDVKMCKTFIEKAKSYQLTMGEDDISKATFSFYKDEVVGHCGSIASKMPYDKNFFVNTLMKKDVASVNNCKMAIKIAKRYVENTDKSYIITQAHKVNVIDNCGTLVVKKAPIFCNFEVVDNSKENIINRCIASIEKAHKYQSSENKNTETFQSYKKEVIANCGGVQTKI